MKPSEFDELVRQKFEQNDFEYNPQNWNLLSKKLEGNAKNRRINLMWWMPLIGVAASVTMAMGITTIIKNAAPESSEIKVEVTKSQTLQTENKKKTEIPKILVDSAIENTTNIGITYKKVNTVITKTDSNSIGISMAAFTNNYSFTTKKGQKKSFNTIDLLAKNEDGNLKKKIKEQPENKNYTFKQEETTYKCPKASIIISGGYNYGNLNNGYMIGATARRMINDKVYVESDIAFTSSNNTQRNEYIVYTHGNAARGSSRIAYASDIVNVNGITKISEQSYNLNYAQVTPSLGYKLMKRMNIGVGPDFQQMLVDNRPEPSKTYKGNIEVAPIFDIGFMAKSEYALSKKIKAAIYYREGINNIITPTNKYIDRNYVQCQIKWAVFNK